MLINNKVKLICVILTIAMLSVGVLATGSREVVQEDKQTIVFQMEAKDKIIIEHRIDPFIKITFVCFLALTFLGAVLSNL